MPQKSSKTTYSAKQKREAAHIEESYEKRGVGPKTAKARAWATVNRQTGGGVKGGSGAKKSKAAVHRSRSASAKRAAVTRKTGHRPASFPKS